MSPEGSFDPDCEFCRIANGLADARIVYEDDRTIAFFPLEPAVIGHTLVTPKAHVADFFTLRPPLDSLVWASTLLVARAVRRALKPEGTNLFTSAGAAATQTIFHLHLHVVPRWTTDRIGPIWPKGSPWPDEIDDGVADKVRAACELELETPT